ncbi:hypothetical protein ABPG75_011442 [Micractinium tetrahymenae]
MPAGSTASSHADCIDVFYLDALLDALTSPVLAPALPRLLAGSEGPLRVRQAARLAARLPLAGPLSEEGASLQGLPARHLRSLAQRHVLALELFVRASLALPGGRRSLWRAGTPQGSSQLAPTQPPTPELQAAAREAVGLAPWGPPLVRLLTSPAMRAAYPEAFLHSAPWTTQLLLLTGHTQRIDSIERMDAWCALAADLLQLVPLAVEAAAAVQQQQQQDQQEQPQHQQQQDQQEQPQHQQQQDQQEQPQQQQQQGHQQQEQQGRGQPRPLPPFSAELQDRCLGVWGQAVRMSREFAQQDGGPLGAASAATLAALAQQFWGLHARACRLVHFCAGASGEQLRVAPQPADWETNVQRLSFTQSAALSAAHLAALEAAPVPPVLLEQAHTATELAVGVAQAVMGAPRATATPQVQALLQRACQAALQDGTTSLRTCRMLALACRHSAHLAAVVVHAGGWGAMLSTLRTLCTRQPQHTPEVRDVLGNIFTALGALVLEGGHAAEAASAAGDAASGARLFQLADALEREMDGHLAAIEALPQGSGVGAVSGLEQRALPLAMQLAQALQAWWEQPAQQAEARLALAHASAVRACAYLRCANVGAPGGAEAGQQPGRRRCGGCRALRYCSEACSHADWAAGHQRVCKALPAAAQAAGP